MISGSGSGSGSSRCAIFSQRQWQELEHQALIFKYMVSGVPIPPQLIYSVKTSLDSSLASCLFPHHQQPSLGWGGCFEVGRKADPEPGRCRRTDGKKWRCSKEAHPDSKYCQRHMHRGRNRTSNSRKPVDANPNANSTSTTPTPTPTPTPTSSSNFISFSPALPPEIYSTHHHNHPFLYSHSAASTSPRHFLDSASLHAPHHHNDHYRYVDGTREGMDERSFFPKAASSISAGSVSVRSVVPAAAAAADSYDQPFAMSSSSYKCQSFRDSSASKQQQCFVLGTDIKSAAAAAAAAASCKPIKIEKDVIINDETQKPAAHQFFGDHWPPSRNTTTTTTTTEYSWLDLASNSGVHSDI